MPTKKNPFVIVASLAEAYHWPIHEIMKLTLPQIILLSHASHANYEKHKARSEGDSDTPRQKRTRTKSVKDEPTSETGQKISDMDSEAMVKYLSVLTNVDLTGPRLVTVIKE